MEISNRIIIVQFCLTLINQGCRGYKGFENLNATMKEINVEAFWQEMGALRD